MTIESKIQREGEIMKAVIEGLLFISGAEGITVNDISKITELENEEVVKLLEELKTSESWLFGNEAKSRHEKYWPNTIQSKDNNSAFKILLSQFTSPLVIILVIAAIISGLIGEGIDAIIICGVVVLNALLGFFQEFKADKAIQSLKKMAGLKSKVLRDGKEMLVDACELTIWDVILLEAWDKIPADGRYPQR